MIPQPPTESEHQDADDGGDASASTHRVTIETPSEGRPSRGGGSGGRLGRAWSAMTARFSKAVETTVTTPGVGIHRGNVDRITPPDDLEEWREIPEDTPIVRKALTDFVSDVVEPGYRVETDAEDAREYLEDVWAPQAAIIGGEKHNDLLPFLRLYVYEKWKGGDALAEHVRSEPAEESAPITGLHMLNPSHVEFVTYEDKNILVDPDPDPGPHPSDDIGDVDAPETRRGEAAAYVQYGDGAIVTSDRDAVPLSQNDVTRSSLDPPAGGLRGEPVTKTIADDVTGFKNILRDKEEAIKTKAYGLWKLSFSREVLEYTDTDENGQDVEVTEILEWGDEEQDEVATEIEKDLGPGAVLTHDGEIDLDRLDGEVPDLIADLEFYVSSILAPLPTPKYVVGFETNINQFVTEKQDERYQKLVNAEREDLERAFSDTMKRVVETNLVENSMEANGRTYSVSEVPEDLEFKVEPPEEDSPVMSLDEDDITRMHTWAQAFSELRGDVPVDSVLDLEEAAQLILQLPEDAVADLEDMPPLAETDPRVQQAAEELGLGDGPPGAEDGEEPEDGEPPDGEDGEAEDGDAPDAEDDGGGGVPPELEADD